MPELDDDVELPPVPLGPGQELLAEVPSGGVNGAGKVTSDSILAAIAASGGGGSGGYVSMATSTQTISATTPAAILGLAPVVFEVTDRPWVVEGHVPSIATAASAGARSLFTILQSLDDPNDIYATATTYSVNPSGSALVIPGLVVSCVVTAPGLHAVRMAAGRNGSGSVNIGNATSSPGFFPYPYLLTAREF